MDVFPADGETLAGGSQDPTQAPVDYTEDPVQSPIDELSTETEPEPTDEVSGWASLGDGRSVLLLDMDGDQRGDALAIDVNSDGVPEVTIERDGEGYLVRWDEQPEGLHVTHDELVKGDAQIAQIVNEQWPPTDQVPQEETSYPEVADGRVLGDPDERAGDWMQQGFNGSCMPASIAQIMTFYTGQQFTDLQFVDLVSDLKAWAPNPDNGAPGMYAQDAVRVMESVGLEARVEEGTYQELQQFIAEDRGIIVTIDSGEVWSNKDGGSEATEDMRADHAVTVTGIDTENKIVYLNDTGTPDGAELAVPLDVFLDAWADSGNEMIVCDQTAEEFRDANDIPQETAGAAVGTGLGGASGPVDRIGGFIRTHPFVLLPIAIGAAALLRNAGKSGK